MSKHRASTKDFHQQMSHWEREKCRQLLASKASDVKGEVPCVTLAGLILKQARGGRHTPNNSTFHTSY